MNEEEAWEVFDGLMLGDAGLVRSVNYAYLSLALSAGDPDQWRGTSWSGRESKVPQIQYLIHIIDCLEPLGVKFSEGHPKAFVRCHQNGKPYLCCKLTSLTSDFLLAQWERWYRPVTDEVRKTRWFPVNRKWYKILPDDIRLTPLTMAKWFEGDGNAAWNHRPGVRLNIATNGFAKGEVERLSALLLPFNVCANVNERPTKKQITWELSVGTIDSINAFYDLIEKLLHPCYNYKIKRAGHPSEYSMDEEEKRLQSELYKVRRLIGK